jgi:hypothetical protein
MKREGLRHGYSPTEWEAAKREATDILSERASRRTNQTIAYSELTDEIKSIKLDPHGVPLAHMLGEISTEEDAAARGMLTVLVVHKGTIEPGPGFFVLAKSLGKDVRDKAKFWSEEFKRVTELHRR